MSSQLDDGTDGPPTTPTEPPAAETEPAPAPAGAASSYKPPRSPAYSPPPPPPVPSYARKTPAPADTSPVAAAPIDRSAQLGWQLLLVGVALVIVAAAVTIAVVVAGGSEQGYVFGEIGAVSEGALVRTGEGESSEARPLDEGESVVAGWVVELPEGAAATLELRDGGVARFDSGARLTFVDDAIDPATGQPHGESRPVIQVRGGRAWVNPGPDAAVAVRVEIPDADIETTGDPVALDCTATCAVEAPAGGVAVSAGDPVVAMAPAPGEIVTFTGPDAFDLSIGDAPSAWAQQNIDADAEAGMPDPAPDDGPGIRGSAVLDGAYVLRLDVVGEPLGDDIPTALQYAAGESYTLDLTTDGSECAPASCRVPVSAPEGASGTAQVTEGTIALTLGQPIDCYDESYTTVVIPEIGTTTVAATLEVRDVDYEGGRWVVRSFDGAGTVAATLNTACNAGDSLGTAASEVTVTGS